MDEQPERDAEYFRRKGFIESPEGWRPPAYPDCVPYTLEELRRYDEIGEGIEAQLSNGQRRSRRRR